MIGILVSLAFLILILKMSHNSSNNLYDMLKNHQPRIVLVNSFEVTVYHKHTQRYSNEWLTPTVFQMWSATA